MRTPSRAACKVWLLLLSALSAIACSGPREATPLPEPPALSPDRIGVPEIVMTVSPSLPIEGRAGAAPANATVRVTNLDSTAAPVAVNATATGAFLLNVPGEPGNELRFQALVDGQRSAPIDFVFSGGTPARLVPSPRHDCVTLTPGFELTFEASGTEDLTILDSCQTALTVSNPRQRRSLPSFSLSTPFPFDLAANASGTVSVTFSGDAGAELEDTLFLDLTSAGSALRYPITLAAPP